MDITGGLCGGKPKPIDFAQQFALNRYLSFIIHVSHQILFLPQAFHEDRGPPIDKSAHEAFM